MATDTTNLTMNRVTGQAVPGITSLNPKAQDLINNMLSGVPGTSKTRRDAAYMGAGAGVPGSDVANRWGYDLYNKRGEALQQQGLGDLLQFLQSGQGQQQIDLSRSAQNLEAQRLAEQMRQFDKTFGWENKKYFDEHMRPNMEPNFFGPSQNLIPTQQIPSGGYHWVK